jgi:hypothetical protein
MKRLEKKRDKTKTKTKKGRKIETPSRTKDGSRTG